MSHKQKYKPHATDGFTLIELLVVVIMVGVIAAISAPSWQVFLDRQRMNAARSDLIGILKSAQDEAQSRQQDKQVTFLPYSASTPLSVRVRNRSASTGGTTTVLGNGQLGQKFRLTAPASTLSFDHDGRVSGVSTPYVIKIRNSQSSVSSTQSQSCVIVTTLLGGLKADNGSVCESFVQ